MNNPDNFSLSSDYLHLANDNQGVSAALSIPANQTLGAGQKRVWTQNFTVDTVNGAFILPFFEISVSSVSGSRVYSYGFGVGYESTMFVPLFFGLSVSRVSSGEWQLKVVLYNPYPASQTINNPAFTVTAGIKTLVVL